MVYRGGQIRASKWANSEYQTQSVRDQKNELVDHIEENPGLKPKIQDTILDTVYRSVIGGLNKDYPAIRFPRTRQLSVEEIVGGDVVALLKKR